MRASVLRTTVWRQALDPVTFGAGGGVTIPDGGFRIFGPAHPDWVRFPDVAFFRRGMVPGDRHGDGWTSIVPDIVVEVVSPGDTTPEVDAKARLWLSVGVASVWVAWPEQERIDVYRAGSDAWPDLGRIRVYKPGSMVNVEGEDILTDERLPGFSVPASSFFP